jgi:predicted DNA-binding transcriptional regulator AlpA
VTVVAFPSDRMGAREPWISRRELAQHLGVCLKTVDNLTHEMPDGATLKLGKSRRYRLSAVERWLKERG